MKYSYAATNCWVTFMDVQVKTITGPLEYGYAPFWYEKTKALYFVNVYQSEVHKYNPATKEHIIARVGNKPVSFIIPIDDFDDKFLIGYGADLAAISWDEVSGRTSTPTIIENVDTAPGNTVTDAKISPGGVLFVGLSGPGDLPSKNLKFNKAALYSFKDCEIKMLIPNISASGGMAWSKTEKTFYFMDSPELRVERYCYDKEANELNRGCVIYEFKDDALPGYPCGMTIDQEGHLWIGCFNGGQVIKINPQNGKSVAKIEIPQCPQITSVIFGGENLDTLYVLSAAYKLDNRMNYAGFVFEVTGLGVSGTASKSLRLIPKK